MEFGELLRHERTLEGLTQEELAKAAGVTSRSIRSLENGATKPRRSTVELLCRALGLSPSRRRQLLRSCGFAARPASGTDGDPEIPAQLPRDIPDFVGRAEILDELSGILLAEGGRPDGVPAIIAINGLGGIGKTSLAIHLAHRVRSSFEGGQLFVDLEGGSGAGRNLDSVLGSLLRDLGVPAARIPVGLSAKSALLRSSSTDRDLLFVFDNARDTAQIRPLLPGSSRCAVLITSRTHLAALEGAVHRGLGPLSPDESRSLLAAARPDEPGDSVSVTRIAEFCAGLPLAVRIAAARLAAPGSPAPVILAELLSRAGERLDGLAVEDLSVRRALTASVSLLDAGGPGGQIARRVLTFLCGWPGGDVGAPCAAAALDVPAPDARMALDHLTAMSLLETRAPARYVPHDLVKLLVAEQAPAGEAPAGEDVLGAAFGWYLHAMDRAVAMFAGYFARPELPGPLPSGLPEFAGEIDALRWTEDEYDNVLALIRYGADAGWDTRTAWLALLAMPFGEQRMRLSQWFEGHQIGLACARRGGERLLEGRFHSGLAAAYRWTGDFPLALEHSDTALAIFRELGDRHRIGVTLVTRGRIPHAAEDFPAAVAAFRDAVAFLRDGGNQQSLASALLQLGMALTRAGDPKAAVPYQLESIEVAAAVGDDDAVATSLLNLSISYVQLGQLDDAASAIERAGITAAGRGGVVLEAEILRQQGEILDAQGYAGRAADLFRRSLALMDSIGYPEADTLRQRAGLA